MDKRINEKQRKNIVKGGLRAGAEDKLQVPTLTSLRLPTLSKILLCERCTSGADVVETMYH